MYEPAIISGKASSWLKNRDLAFTPGRPCRCHRSERACHRCVIGVIAVVPSMAPQER